MGLLDVQHVGQQKRWLLLCVTLTRANSDLLSTHVTLCVFWCAGVIEVAEGLDERACRTNPIRCRVTGGYTISKQSGYGADSSPETLLTCILQVASWVWDTPDKGI
jgi:hypothetical protein